MEKIGKFFRKIQNQAKNGGKLKKRAKIKKFQSKK